MTTDSAGDIIYFLSIVILLSNSQELLVQSYELPAQAVLIVLRCASLRQSVDPQCPVNGSCMLRTLFGRMLKDSALQLCQSITLCFFI